MADERDQDQTSDTPDSTSRSTDKATGQPIGGNDSNTGSGTTLSQGADFGDQGATSSGSEPPRSMGTHGNEFGQMSDPDRSGQQGQSATGQADLGTQADSTLSGRTDQQGLGIDQPGSVAGATGQQNEGFMAQQDGESPSSARATGGSDFANQGRGALDEDQESEGSASEHSAFTSGKGSNDDQ